MDKILSLSGIIMDTDTVKYLIDHFLYLVPFGAKGRLKYPYLEEHEVKNEKKQVAEIILKDYKEKVFMNNCPNCGKLARTPKSKQCRFCGENWHQKL